jgi:hypothetical protein
VSDADDASLLAEAAKSIGRIPGQLIEGVGGILQILGSAIGGILPGITSAEGSELGRLISEVGVELQDPIAPHPSISQRFEEEGFVEGGLFSPLWWASVVPGEAAMLVATIFGGVGVAAKMGQLGKFMVFAAPTAVREGGVAANRSFLRGMDSGLSLEESANQAAGVGALTTIGTTALEAFPFATFVMRRVPGAGREYFASLARSTNRLLQAAEGAASEGLTEVAQEALADSVEAWMEENPQAFDDGLDRYLAAFTVGGVLGAGARLSVDRFITSPMSQKRALLREGMESLEEQLSEGSRLPRAVIRERVEAAGHRQMGLVRDALTDPDREAVRQAAELGVVELQTIREAESREAEEVGEPDRETTRTVMDEDADVALGPDATPEERLAAREAVDEALDSGPIEEVAAAADEGVGVEIAEEVLAGERVIFQGEEFVLRGETMTAQGPRLIVTDPDTGAARFLNPEQVQRGEAVEPEPEVAPEPTPTPQPRKKRPGVNPFAPGVATVSSPLLDAANSISLQRGTERSPTRVERVRKVILDPETQMQTVRDAQEALEETGTIPDGIIANMIAFQVPRIQEEATAIVRRRRKRPSQDLISELNRKGQQAMERQIRNNDFAKVRALDPDDPNPFSGFVSTRKGRRRTEVIVAMELFEKGEIAEEQQVTNADGSVKGTVKRIAHKGAFPGAGSAVHIQTQEGIKKLKLREVFPDAPTEFQLSQEGGARVEAAEEVREEVTRANEVVNRVMTLLTDPKKAVRIAQNPARFETLRRELSLAQAELLPPHMHDIILDENGIIKDEHLQTAVRNWRQACG